jgi:hypothetical protein
MTDGGAGVAPIVIDARRAGLAGRAEQDDFAEAVFSLAGC